jgi:hypothetical protein
MNVVSVHKPVSAAEFPVRPPAPPE